MTTAERQITHCSVIGCESPAVSRGWCDKHYCRWKRTGSTETRVAIPAADRFWAKVTKGTPSECWLWEGAEATPGGYGRFWPSGTKRGGAIDAHRFAFMLANGIALKSDVVVRHTCDNPPCVNPNHLRMGTHTDNMRDKVERNRQYRPTGELNGMARLTEERVRSIRAQIAEGAAREAIAAHFGITTSLVSKIRTKKRWASVA